jgi:hypothetical protein
VSGKLHRFGQATMVNQEGSNILAPEQLLDGA